MTDPRPVGRPPDWQWVDATMSERIGPVSEEYAKEFARLNGGTASPIPIERKAGRPRTPEPDRSRSTSIWLKPWQIARLRVLGGSRWVQKMIGPKPPAGSVKTPQERSEPPA